MSWNGQLYIDTVVPFGLRSAPKVFSAVADAVEWVPLQFGVSILIRSCGLRYPLQKQEAQVAETRGPSYHTHFPGHSA